MMALEIPSDIQASVRAFVATGQYNDEAEVLRAALVALKGQGDASAAILEGMEDEAAGRLTPARQVIAAAKQSLASAAE